LPPARYRESTVVQAPTRGRPQFGQKLRRCGRLPEGKVGAAAAI